MINLLKNRLMNSLLVSLSAVYKLQYHFLFLIVFVGIGIPLHSISAEYVEEDIIIEDVVVAPQSQTPVVKTYSAGQPKVVIYNNHKVDQTSAQAPNISTQPVLRVTGVPITKAPTAELRQSRQEAELHTEQQIVEKLESSRLRDEQERLNRLFPSGAAKTVVADGAAMTPVDISAQVQAPSSVHDTHKDNLYLGFYAGQAGNVFQQVNNLESYGSFGISAGSYFQSGIILEGSFAFTPHAITPTQGDVNYQNHFDQSYSTDIQQWSGMLALKYSPFSSRLKPYFGLVAAYNQWIYRDHSSFNYSCESLHTSYCSGLDYNSHSIDFGVTVGFDVQLNKKLSIGLSVVMNVYNIYHNNTTRDPYAAQQAEYNRWADYHGDPYSERFNKRFKPEEMKWIIASINAKLYF